MVVEGEDVVNVLRYIIGSINFLEVLLGLIRGDLGLIVGRNIIYGLDLLEFVECEINLWFNENEIISYVLLCDVWLYE